MQAAARNALQGRAAAVLGAHRGSSVYGGGACVHHLNVPRHTHITAITSQLNALQSASPCMPQPLACCALTLPCVPPLSCSAHTGPVWSLAALPDSSGFVSGSADHEIKFWEWGVAADPDTGAKQLAISHTRCAGRPAPLRRRIAPPGCRPQDSRPER